MNEVRPGHRRPTGREVEELLSSRVAVAIRIEGMPEVRLVFDPARSVLAMWAPWDGADPPDLSSYNRLTCRQLIVDELPWLELAVCDLSVLSDAYAFLGAFADHVQQDKLPAGQAVRVVVDAYQDILSMPGLMSEELEVGLFGELTLLRHLIKTIGPGPALAAWQGPSKGEHDFTLPEGEVEVKTTLAEGRSHWINGLGQLEPSVDRRLWLISFQFTVNSEGQTLADLIGSIRTELADAKHVDRFMAEANKGGWRDRYAAGTGRRLLPRTPPAIFGVGESFPALTEARLVHSGVSLERIRTVRYQIVLNGLAQDEHRPKALMGLWVPEEIKHAK